MMYYNGYGPGYGFDGLEMLSHILWFFLIVALIVIAIRLIIGRPRRWHRFMGGSALDILAERFAKGEISKEEYEKRRDVLMK